MTIFLFTASTGFHGPKGIINVRFFRMESISYTALPKNCMKPNEVWWWCENWAPGVPVSPLSAPTLKKRTLPSPFLCRSPQTWSACQPHSPGKWGRDAGQHLVSMLTDTINFWWESNKQKCSLPVLELGNRVIQEHIRNDYCLVPVCVCGNL